MLFFESSAGISKKMQKSGELLPQLGIRKRKNKVEPLFAPTVRTRMGNEGNREGDLRWEYIKKGTHMALHLQDMIFRIIFSIILCSPVPIFLYLCRR